MSTFRVIAEVALQLSGYVVTEGPPPADPPSEFLQLVTPQAAALAEVLGISTNELRNLFSPFGDAPDTQRLQVLVDQAAVGAANDTQISQLVRALQDMQLPHLAADVLQTNQVYANVAAVLRLTIQEIREAVRDQRSPGYWKVADRVIDVASTSASGARINEVLDAVRLIPAFVAINERACLIYIERTEPRYLGGFAGSF